MQALAIKEKQLAESANKIAQAQKLVETKEREVRIIKESSQREQVLDELLAPLNEEKAAVMKTLLESVQTTKLKNAFDKYLPAVLNTGSEVSAKPSKAALTESKVVTEVTGDKSAKKIEEVDTDAKDNVIEIKRLAGL
jgi:hypothetical protein